LPWLIGVVASGDGRQIPYATAPVTAQFEAVIDGRRAQLADLAAIHAELRDLAGVITERVGIARRRAAPVGWRERR
jgi:hypothetical protein